MSIATITLSGQGQTLMPQEDRDQLHRCAGMQITLLPCASGVTLKTASMKTGSDLEDLNGVFNHMGPIGSTEALFSLVKYAKDWATFERRSK